MTPDAEGENKMKVIKALRSEAITQGISLLAMESNRKIPEDKQQQLIDLLRSHVTVIRNMNTLLAPMPVEKENESDAEEN